MPTIINKLVDKAKPRLSFHRHPSRKSGSTSSNESHHQKFHAMTNAISNHVFGYKDDKNDDYVEPPPGKRKKENCLATFILYICL